MKNFSPGSSEVSSQGQNWEAVGYPVSRQDGCCQQRRNCTQEEKLHCVSRQEFPGSPESARWGCRGAGPWGRLQGPCGWGKHTQPTYWDKPQGDRGFIAPVSLFFPPAAYVLACMTTSAFHPGMSPGTDSKSPGAQMRILSWFPPPRPHCCNEKTSPDVLRVSCTSYSGHVPAGLCFAVREHVSPSHHP